MSCKIQVCDQYGVYLAGSAIIGKVLCNFKNYEEFQTISIKLEGSEKVCWWESKTSYSGKNTILLDTKLLASAGRVAPGCVEYPFAFALPQNIPTSFEGLYGKLQYTLRARVHRRSGTDYIDKIPISVLSHLSIDKLPDRRMLRSNIFDAEKTICCSCLSGGQISMEAYLEKRAFQQGDKIKIALRIANHSNTRIKKIRTEFVSYIKSQVYEGDHSIQQKKVIAKTEDAGFGAHEERHYEISLVVPIKSKVPNFINSKHFSSSSQLEIVAVLPTFHVNLYLYIPTFFANYPIDESTPDERIEELHTQMPKLVLANLVRNRGTKSA